MGKCWFTDRDSGPEGTLACSCPVMNMKLTAGISQDPAGRLCCSFTLRTEAPSVCSHSGFPSWGVRAWPGFTKLQLYCARWCPFTCRLPRVFLLITLYLWLSDKLGRDVILSRQCQERQSDGNSRYQSASITVALTNKTVGLSFHFVIWGQLQRCARHCCTAVLWSTTTGH